MNGNTTSECNLGTAAFDLLGVRTLEKKLDGLLEIGRGFLDSRSLARQVGTQGDVQISFSL